MTNRTQTCPVCEAGGLSVVRTSLDIDYAGRTLTVDGIEHSVCNSCGAEPVLPEQIRRNDLRIADAKRSADGLLRSDQIRELRTLLGLTQAEAAQVFGGGANAFSKYERGEVIQSAPMDRLMRVTAAFPWIIELLRAQAGLATDIEPLEGIAVEYTDDLTIHIKASKHPGSTLPGRTDVTPIDDDHDGWKAAA